MLARLLLCLSLFTIALPAYAQEEREPRKMHKMGKMGKRYKAMWKRLDLAQDQRDKLFALQQKLEATTFGHRQAKEAATYELHSRLRAPTFEEGAVTMAADKMVEAEKQMLAARIEFVKEMRTILKPEQLQKLHHGFQEMPAP